MCLNFGAPGWLVSPRFRTRLAHATAHHSAPRSTLHALPLPSALARSAESEEGVCRGQGAGGVGRGMREVREGRRDAGGANLRSRIRFGVVRASTRRRRRVERDSALSRCPLPLALAHPRAWSASAAGRGQRVREERGRESRREEGGGLGSLGLSHLPACSAASRPGRRCAPCSFAFAHSQP